MARLESGYVKPHLDWCDVNDIVNAALKRAGGELANRDVSARVPPGFPLVRVDSRLIEQALVDLLLNAAMHTPAGTPVEVIKRLSSEVDAALRNPAVAKRLTDLGAVPVGGSAEKLAAFQLNEQEKWGKVIQAAKIKAE